MEMTFPPRLNPERNSRLLGCLRGKHTIKAKKSLDEGWVGVTSTAGTIREGVRFWQPRGETCGTVRCGNGAAGSGFGLLFYT